MMMFVLLIFMIVFTCINNRSYPVEPYNWYTTIMYLNVQNFMISKYQLGLIGRLP